MPSGATSVPPPGYVTSNLIACTVSCALGGKVSSVLAFAPRTTGGLTITIKGTCVESDDDVPSGVTLQGASPGNGLQAPSASTDPVLGISGGVTLNNLTLSGEVNTLRGRGGAHFTGTNLVIEGASNADVLINHAVVTLNTSTIQSSANDGIIGDYGNTVYLNGGVVQGNAQWGAHFARDASLEIYGGAVLQNNRLGGAEAYDGAAIYLDNGTVQKNAGSSGGDAGLEAGAGGHVRIYGSNSSVVGNAVYGLSGYRGGTVIVDDGAVVANNMSDGIHLYGGASGMVRARAVIGGNGGSGILCPKRQYYRG